MEAKMKTCFKCNQTLPLCDFYRHPQMKDGHLNKCKECTKKDSSTKDPVLYERRKERDRNRFNAKERTKQNQARIKRLQQENPEKYRKQVVEPRKKWQEENKNKSQRKRG